MIVAGGVEEGRSLAAADRGCWGRRVGVCHWIGESEGWFDETRGLDRGGVCLLVSCMTLWVTGVTEIRSQTLVSFKGRLKSSLVRSL